LGPGMNLDAEACRAMAKIFEYTEQTAPNLLARVKELVVQFIRYRDSVHDFLPGLDRQIEIESSGKLEIRLDSRPVPIPPGFRNAYKSIFPDIHRRVYLNLNDKSKVPEALVEIFVDFLVHEDGLDQLEDHHISLLNEIADQTCARLSGQPPEEYVAAEPDDTPVPDARRLCLDEDVMKSMEQELTKLVQAQT